MLLTENCFSTITVGLHFIKLITNQMCIFKYQLLKKYSCEDRYDLRGQLRLWRSMSVTKIQGLGQFYLHVSIKAFEVCKMIQGNILRTPYGVMKHISQ